MRVIDAAVSRLRVLAGRNCPECGATYGHGGGCSRPGLQEIIRTTCASRGLTVPAARVEAIAAKARQAPETDTLDVLEREIACLDREHLDDLIAAKEHELRNLRARRRRMN